jgi:hypothetical protein
VKTHDMPMRSDSSPSRWAQAWPERTADTYKLRGKLREPSMCSDCGVVYHRGSWRWLDVPEGAEAVLCPACHRIRDHQPAGFLKLEGDLLQLQRDELMNQIRNVERAEGGEHALERIMGIEESGPGWLVTTTGVHLARRLGEALHDAHQGTLTFQYNQDEKVVRVHWHA